MTIELICDGCHSTESEVKHIAQIKTDYICDKCTHSLTKQWNELDNPEQMTSRPEIDLLDLHNMNSPKRKLEESSLSLIPKYQDWPPYKIKQAMDEYITDQDEATKIVAIAVYNHLKRIQNPEIDDVEIDKSNVLLIGPTGTGKTLIANTIHRLFNLPIVVRDATDLTAAGYVGSDIDTILQTLLTNADDDVALAEVGIIFIDEIDKIRRVSDSPSLIRDVSGEDVQQGLLKIIEGMECHIASGNRKHPSATTTKIDTKHILFICGGSFAGIEDQIEASESTSSIGFGADVTKEEKGEFNYASIENKHLIKFGMIPELIGRLQARAYTQPLSRDSLRKILTEPKNALLKQFVAAFKIEGTELSFSEAIINKFLDEATKNGSGARGLRAAVEEEMVEIQYIAPSLKLEKIVVGETSLSESDILINEKRVKLESEKAA
jgi:ATP-dependent Clp protease ATP-binding subunit ClpX